MIHRIKEAARKHPSLWLVFPCVTLLICFLQCFAYSTFDVSNSTDSSWQYSLSGLRHSSQVLGRDVFFNYGPLYSRLATTVHSKDTLKDFVVSNLLFLFLAGTAIVALLRLARHWRLTNSRNLKLATILIASYMLVSITRIDDLFYPLMLLYFFSAQEEHHVRFKLLALSGIYLLSLYKFSYILPVVLLSPFAFINTPFKSHLKNGGLWLVSLVGFVGMFFALIGSVSFSALGRYMYYGTLNAVYYNDFMSLSVHENQAIQILTFALFASTVLGCAWLIIRVVRGRHLGRHVQLVTRACFFTAVFFMAYKHAIVRSDDHLVGISAFFFLLYIFMYACLKSSVSARSSQTIPGRTMLSVMFLLSLSMNFYVFGYFASSTTPSLAKSRIDLLKNSTVTNRFNYGYFRSSVILSAHKIQKRSEDISSIQQQLNQKYPGREVVFYGNTTLYGEALKSSRQVLYMPFLQNYAAHPPNVFNKAYIDFLKQHPSDLVFAEEREPSINERIPAHELDDFFQYLTHDYKLVLADHANHQYVFERVSNSIAVCTPLRSFTFSDDQLVQAPHYSPVDGSYLKLMIHTQNSPTEKLFSLLLKAPIYTLTITNPGGGSMARRTTVATLADGITINPFYQSLSDFDNKSPFVLAAFSVNDGFPTHTYFAATPYICKQ